MLSSDDSWCSTVETRRMTTAATIKPTTHPSADHHRSSSSDHSARKGGSQPVRPWASELCDGVTI